MPADTFPHEALGVVFQVRDARLTVLLWRRAEPPFEETWSLPGGRLSAGERLGASASRHLAAKVDIPQVAHLEQLETRSDPVRDPRERVLATAYLALVTPDAQPRLPLDTAWHPVDDLPPTAFDHGSIIGSARNRLRAKLSYTNIGFALSAETFTISQLRDTYAAALGHPISATNLQRILTRRGVIEPTNYVVRPTATGGRPATVYRFAARELVVTNPFAAFRPRVAGLRPGEDPAHRVDRHHASHASQWRGLRSRNGEQVRFTFEKRGFLQAAVATVGVHSGQSTRIPRRYGLGSGPVTHRQRDHERKGALQRTFSFAVGKSTAWRPTLRPAAPGPVS